VDDELFDLIPLFMSEARERVEHLLELAPQVETSSSAVVEARREFHTLKGSCRMLKLPVLADLCHQGEEILESIGSGTGARVTSLLDRLSALIEGVARGETGPGPTQPPAGVVWSPPPENAAPQALPVAPPPDLPLPPSVAPAAETRPAAVPVRVQASAANGGAHGDEETAETTDLTGGDHRISARAADQLAAGAADLRIRALTGVALADRAGQLAKLAEGGVMEAQPEQVLAMVSSALRQLATEVEANQRRMLQRAEEQLDTLLALQLQPLRPFLLSLARHTRELAGALHKEVEVELQGGEARLDRRISAELHGAFLHLVRNAVDHGVEAPGLRRERGKRERGVVRIAATSLGDRVEIAVEDDGAGIDPREVVATARRAGLLDGDAEPTDQQALQLVLRAGFSTRQRVSEVSGRGVGLDAVSGAVRRLGGEIWIESTPGVGTRVHVVVPAARRGERVVVLRVGFSRLALVRSAVASISRLPADALVQGQGGWLARLGERLVPVLALSDMLGEEPVEEPVLLEVQAAGVSRYLVVGEVEGVEEVLVRPFSSLVPAPPLYTALALLASGEPVPVLSTRALGDFHSVSETPSRAAHRPVRLRVLLVEDSLVTREMERRLLEDEGFDVTAVAGARQALSELAEGSFDCVVTDIEMPEMNGLELTRKLRGMERFAQLPILVVSTLDRPEDRLAGLQAGADAYLSKQELQAQKIGAVIRRLGGGQ
jgi:chemotaxis protein histidine kinase CheA/CheY-like chemotaxis protein